MHTKRALLVCAALGSAACGGTSSQVARPPASSSSGAAAASGAIGSPRGETALAKPPLSGSTEEALGQLLLRGSSEFSRGLAAGAHRVAVMPTAFRPADLPVARLFDPPVLDDYLPVVKSTPPKLGPRDPELVVATVGPAGPTPAQDHQVRLTLRDPPSNPGFGLGLSQLGSVEHLDRPKGGAVGGNLEDHCGSDYASARWLPFRWSRVTEQEDGVHVAIGDAVLDRVDCIVHTIHRTDAKAAPLAPGHAIFGFLGCAENCETRASLVVVMPRAANVAATSLGRAPLEQVGAFTIFVVPIEHGGGASVEAAVNGADLAGWHRALAMHEVSSLPKNTSLGVEVTQSVREPAALGIAYTDTDAGMSGPLAERPKVLAPPRKTGGVLVF